MPPHMIDLSRHLAVVSSVVVRHTRRTLPTRTGAAAEQDFDEFCQQCLEIEENALRRVSTYASIGKSRRKLSSAGALEAAAPESPVSPRSTRQRDRKTSWQDEEGAHSPRTNARVLKKRSPRASSVPPPASSEASHSSVTLASQAMTSRTQSQELTQHEVASLVTDSSPTLDTSVLRPIRPSLGHHARSTSTDSALWRNKYSMPISSSTSAYLTADRLDSKLDEDPSQRKKGLLRGFRRK
jgi:hypothetical protein